jgi:hypothetical protein
VFQLWQGTPGREALWRLLRQHAASARGIEGVRPLLGGLRWSGDGAGPAGGGEA